MPLDDEIREMYRTMRKKKEIIQDISHNGFSQNFQYHKYMRSNELWERWEDDMLLKNQNNKQLSRYLFRTIRAVRERKLYLKERLKTLDDWRTETRVRYMCCNCSHVSYKPGLCGCHTLEYKLIPPDNDQKIRT